LYLHPQSFYDFSKDFTFDISSKTLTMPLNKEALIRYRVINRCLVDYGVASKKEVNGCLRGRPRHHPLGERTIDKDISDMRFDQRLGFNAPFLLTDKGGYYYETPIFDR